MPDKIKTAQDFTPEYMQHLAKMIKLCLPPGVGFTALFFDFNALGMTQYVSNANREDMIKSMQAIVDRLKAKEGQQGDLN